MKEYLSKKEKTKKKKRSFKGYFIANIIYLLLFDRFLTKKLFIYFHFWNGQRKWLFEKVLKVVDKRQLLNFLCVCESTDFIPRQIIYGNNSINEFKTHFPTFFF